MPVTLLPLFMAALCGIASVQQRSRPLRTLAVGSLLEAVTLPTLLPGGSDPCWSLAAALLLTSSGLSLRAVGDMMGRRSSPTWILAAPLGWGILSLIFRMVAGGWTGGPSLVAFLSSLAADDVMWLLCLPPLLASSKRSLSHTGMICVATLRPSVSCLYAVAAIWPTSSLGVVIERAAMPIWMAELVLWPGLAILTATEMATRRERRLALRDELSGLLNRRGFFRKVTPMPSRALLLFDIDHFKRINDTYGHAAGDEAIRRFARVLTDLAGRGAVLGRVGGEEFTAAISGLSEAHALELADRIRRTFADVERALGTGVTVSIGIALPTDVPISLSEQMAAADRALYRAKRNGRNRVELAEEPLPADLDPGF